jgi:hypothetical protein
VWTTWRKEKSCPHWNLSSKAQLVATPIELSWLLPPPMPHLFINLNHPFPPLLPLLLFLVCPSVFLSFLHPLLRPIIFPFLLGHVTSIANDHSALGKRPSHVTNIRCTVPVPTGSPGAQALYCTLKKEAAGSSTTWHHRSEEHLFHR